jgi:hypothetical protein
MDILGFIIGMAVLLGVLYILVYPVTESFARGKLETATGIHGKNINPVSIPIRYYSFFGSLIFTIIGFMMGVIFGMFFIGFSLRGRDLPGVFSLVVASISGSMLLTQPRNAGWVPYSMGILIAIIGISWYLMGQHDTKTMQWLSLTPVISGQPATPPAPDSSQNPLHHPQKNQGVMSGKAIQPLMPVPTPPANTLPISQFCIHCGNRIQKPKNFCENCGKNPDK